jgi:ketosteroid isomerase-like protein
MSANNLTVIQAVFDYYRRGDGDAAGPLYAEDFRFTSPQDDHIDKDAFFERCFPTASRVVRHETIHQVPADEESSFVMYEYELGPDTESPGAVHRNVELITVRNNQVTEVQVFFGGRVTCSQ